MSIKSMWWSWWCESYTGNLYGAFLMPLLLNLCNYVTIPVKSHTMISKINYSWHFYFIVCIFLILFAYVSLISSIVFKQINMVFISLNSQWPKFLNIFWTRHIEENNVIKYHCPKEREKVLWLFWTWVPTFSLWHMFQFVTWPWYSIRVACPWY